MAIQPIVMMGDPILRTVASEVDAFDDELMSLTRDLLETMYHAGGAGLAAPQIGCSKRVIVINLKTSMREQGYGEGEGDIERQHLVLINPRVAWESAASNKEPEGCLSIPDLDEFVRRSTAIRVEAVGVDGADLEFPAEEYFARVLQHEIDHLDGILFVDRISALKRRILMKKWKKIQAEED